MKKSLIAIASAMLLMTSFAYTQAEEAAAKAKPTCPVSGKDIDKTKIVSHNGGDVYFCCANCPKAFKANTDKFAPKANHQLVLTGQAKQKACPFAGKPVNESKTTKVAGVKVGFCCGNCLAKAKEAKGDKQLALVFSDKAFLKGFKVAKK